MKALLLGCAALAACCLTGCKATHLIYVYDLSVGIDVAASTEGTGRLIFGYDRGTYALVPQRTDHVAVGGVAGTDTGELMSLTATSYVSSRGLDEFEFDHFVSTGDAAVDVANDPNGLEEIRRALFRRTGR
jgi:hypothetical protein